MVAAVDRIRAPKASAWRAKKGAEGDSNPQPHCSMVDEYHLASFCFVIYVTDTC
jgi:hypothetical protein